MEQEWVECVVGGQTEMPGGAKLWGFRHQLDEHIRNSFDGV